MDELRNFFNDPCPSTSQIKKIRGPLTGGLRITKENELDELNRRQEHRHAVVPTGTDYVREVRQREMELYRKNANRPQSESIAGGLESMEQLSSWGMSMPNIGQLNEEAMTTVYSKYTFKKREDTTKLAIEAHKQEIYDAIEGFGVVVIEGPTGCGKTTQVPQWILDDCYQKRKPCKIIVTQPRRIAAISIAKRVAQERGWNVGGIVGYQVGLDNQTTADTRIHYVTTGVLLQKLVAAKTMNEYTHVILDEVHERGQEMDFLLLVVKRLYYTVSSKVKIILMSATFNYTKFAEYFDVPSPIALTMSVVVNIRKEPTFTVKTFYLNDLLKFGGNFCKQAPREEPMIATETYHLVIKLLHAFERIDKHEDNYEDRSHADLPSVLIFLPGINEIEELFLCLEDLKLREKITDAECATYNWSVIPLHSTITADEQVRVFHRAKPGQRKIILATNIAESSITVPDIKYVIDFCLTKVLVADQATNFTSLTLEWASKANCEQRAGRAGRVRDGRVYRLVTEKFYENLADESRPEILRCPLDRLVLLSKMLDMGEPSDVLALAMDAPDMSNIHRTILVLKEIGALRKTLNGEWSPSDGDITYLGRVMAKLPLDVRATKLIVLGYFFACLEDAVVMAASMSVKNVFSSPFRERFKTYKSKLTWADGSMSDCIAFLNVYKVWTHLRQQQHFRQQQNNSEAQWARRFFLQIRSLKELDDLVRELKMRLSYEGIDANTVQSPWDKHEIPLVLKVIMAGAMYPQYFVQVSQDESREREAVRTLGGYDPRNTVYLKNFPDNQPGEIYAGSIKRAVRQQIGDEPRVHFDANSRKVYLTFDAHNGRDQESNNDPTIPGQVVLSVYKAIKARQLKLDIRIPLLPLDKAKEVAQALELEKKMNLNLNKMVPRLPDVDDSHFSLKITEKISVSRFWVQYNDESTAEEVRHIVATLNRANLIAHTGPVAPGDVFAGPFVDSQGTTMHRVRVLKLLPRDMVEVEFIDYGNRQRLNTCNLFLLPPGICRDKPPLAMECVLAEIAPTPLFNQHGQWSPRAMQLFNRLVEKGKLWGKVYSVTHGIVAIELLVEKGTRFISVNKELIKNGFAVPAEESYDSKLNHDLREMATELNLAQIRAFNKEQTDLAISHTREIEPPKAKDCITDVVLKGPFSPLETVVHNLMYGSREKQVAIEWQSVNSVLLDTNPQEVYERLLVAADVGQNELSSKLTLRHTTLMPNVPALPAIISLLFCPCAELRRDAEKTRYVSALCGLGSTDDGTPYFPEHDLLVNIDADFDVQDISQINHIRLAMDFMLRCGEMQDLKDQSTLSVNVPTVIRDGLLYLLQKRRKHREPEVVVKAWEWKSVPEEDFLEPSDPELDERVVIYPLVSPLELHAIPREQLIKLKEDNDQLKLLVARTPISSTTELTCKLCGTIPMPAHAMRIHLYSNAHKEKEEDLLAFQS